MTLLIMSSLNMARTDSSSSSNSISSRTKHLCSLYSKAIKTVITLPHTGNSIKQVKELMTFQNSSASSTVSERKENPKPKIQDLDESKFLQNKTKDIKVITRNDLLYNTYDLDYKSSQAKPITRSKSSNSYKSHNSHKHHHSKRNPTSASLPAHRFSPSSKQVPLKRNALSYSEPRTPRSLTPTFDIQHVDPIDTVNDGSIKPFVPEDYQIKNELVFLNNTFTENGALLSIPIHKTITRDSDISDYKSSFEFKV